MANSKGEPISQLVVKHVDIMMKFCQNLKCDDCGSLQLKTTRKTDDHYTVVPQKILGF